ncbi:MAG: hypothetical protein ACLSHC_02855 [Bilophila wadsworthia]
MCQRSSMLVILLVAWRVTASARRRGCPRRWPDPDEALPAVFQRDLDQRCSGVKAVSTSSLTTLAGRSTTSPAAI